MQKTLLFVYGTLKTGHIRAKYLQYERYLGIGILPPNYEMYHLGGCPALIKIRTAGTVQVYGELYEVNEDCLPPIDQVEGVSHGIYERKYIDLESVNLSYLPTDSRVSELLFSKRCETYLYRKDVEGAKKCGPVWCKS